MWNVKLPSLKDMKFGFVDSMHDTQSSLDSAKDKEAKLNSEIDNYYKTNQNNEEVDNKPGKSLYEEQLEELNETREFIMQSTEEYDKTEDDIEKIDKQIQDAEKAEEQKKTKEQNAPKFEEFENFFDTRKI